MQSQMPFNQFLDAMFRQSGRFAFDPIQRNWMLLRQGLLERQMPQGIDIGQGNATLDRSRAPILTGSWTPRPGGSPMMPGAPVDPTQGRYYQQLTKQRGGG